MKDAAEQGGRVSQTVKAIGPRIVGALAQIKRTLFFDIIRPFLEQKRTL